VISRWFDEPRTRQDVVAVPILWLTIALSILIHVGALFLGIPRTPLFATKGPEQDEANERLQVQLAAQVRPTPPPQQFSPERPVSSPPLAKPPKPALRMRPPPAVIPPIAEAPELPLPPPAAPAVVAPPRAIPPMEGDLWAYIQARRRERGEQESAPDDEKAQLNRNLAANLPAPARGVAAQDTKRGGGIFEIKRMAYDDAAFEFYGWNRAMGRKTPQLIEVRKGDNSDMRIAVVRRMIAIIRQFEKEDFVWESTRRDRKFVLSARLSDNAALEDFLMHEFFDGARYAQ